MKKKMFRFLGFSFLFLGIGGLFLWYFENEKTKKIMDELEEVEKIEEVGNQIIYYPPEGKDDLYALYVDVPFLTIDFDPLIEENEDTVGWIRIPKTNIDYPIVQTKDNKYYLSHNFKKASSSAGWIFLDYRSTFLFERENTIIYGHGRLDGSMFGSLRSMLEKDWFEKKENHYIQLSTLNENRVYEIVSIYSILPETYYLTIFFETKEKWIDYLSNIQRRSIYPFDVTLDQDTELLTLSTCQNKQERLVVHARLIKKEIRN